MPAPFKSVDTQVAVLLEELDLVAGAAVVTTRRSLDASALDLSPDGDGPSMDVNDSSRYLVDLVSGLPTAAEFERTVLIGGTRRVDWMRFTRQP